MTRWQKTGVGIYVWRSEKAAELILNPVILPKTLADSIFSEAIFRSKNTSILIKKGTIHEPKTSLRAQAGRQDRPRHSNTHESSLRGSRLSTDKQLDG